MGNQYFPWLDPIIRLLIEPRRHFAFFTPILTSLWHYLSQHHIYAWHLSLFFHVRIVWMCKIKSARIKKREHEWPNYWETNSLHYVCIAGDYPKSKARKICNSMKAKTLDLVASKIWIVCMSHSEKWRTGISVVPNLSEMITVAVWLLSVELTIVTSGGGGVNASLLTAPSHLRYCRRKKTNYRLCYALNYLLCRIY